MSRPEVPFPAGDGFEWTAVVDEDWSLDSGQIEGWRCVARVAGDRCPNDAAAVLYRGTWAGLRPWRYCAEHMYGRWIEDGKVAMWRLFALAPVR